MGGSASYLADVRVRHGSVSNIIHGYSGEWLCCHALIGEPGWRRVPMTS